MAIGLGIDTGGTYTDGVLYRAETGEILARAKSPTTHNKLSVGIRKVLEQLPGDLLRQAEMAALSTTLATNACVEGKGCRCGLILLGYDEGLVRRLAAEYGLDKVEPMAFLPGSHGQRGQVVTVPDWQQVEQAAREMAPGVEAIGVCEYWGLRDPEFEVRARAIVAEATGLPVVAAHELSAEINSLRRAATTALNGRLIPLISELLAEVKVAFGDVGVTAPLMIVRGDGSLMTEAFAAQRPVETLLSGPAASVVGAMGMSGCRDCIVLDVGGTTTDLAVVREGYPGQSEEGVNVGGWRTGTSAIGIRTIGLGGDSRIAFDKKEKLTLGPRRVVPLCDLAQRYPAVLEELRRIRKEDRFATVPLAEFYVLEREPDIPLNSREQKIVEALRQGPLSLTQLSEAVNQPIYFLDTQRLSYMGCVMLCGLTPTDLMHVTGDMALWNGEAARLGAEVMANRLQLTVRGLVRRVFDRAAEMMYALTADALLERAYPKDSALRMDKNPALMLGCGEHPGELKIQVSTDLTLVGIGAPAHLFIPKVADRLHAPCVIPENAGVANAVGAVTGSVAARAEVHIRPHYEAQGVTGYSAHGMNGRRWAEEYEEAVAIAREMARQDAVALALQMGAPQVQVTVEVKERTGNVSGEGAEALLLETLVCATAMGKPSLEPPAPPPEEEE